MRKRFDLHDVLFPARCIGCRVLNKGLCPRCSLHWRLNTIESHVGGLSIFSSLHYSSVASHVLLAAKEDGVREADELLVGALRQALRNSMTSHENVSVLVPIPSADRANRKRGRFFMGELVKKVATSESLVVWNALEHRRKVVDQTQLSVPERHSNLLGAMRIAGTAKMGRGIILVDDLVTSGATLSEAVRTLQAGGMPVLGAITAFLAHPIR
jgi:predicted amidophosphoribosyltransferase